MRTRVAAVFGALMLLPAVLFADSKVRVAFVPAGPTAEALRARLVLDPGIEVVVDPSRADVLWLLPGASRAEVKVAAAARARGAGLVLVPGQDDVLAPLGVQRIAAGGTAPVDLSARRQSHLGQAVSWRSAPKLRARVPLFAPGVAAVEVAGEGAVVREGDRLVVLGLRPDDPSNQALWRWGYFNYLLYAATVLAAGQEPKPFHVWPAAPLPRRGTRTGWVLFILAIWPVSLGAFLWARRAARRREDSLIEPFFLALQARSPAAGGAAAWSRVGFERPLGGFFVLTGALLVFIAPYVVVVQFVLPTYVQQFPEVDGMWYAVYDFFYWVWMLFDLGTSVAFVKFFAELRVKDPREALSAVQFYTWWQILTGALQVTIVGLLGVFYVPRTEYALFSHLVALYALSQWPGFFYTLAYFFQAVQRFDYYQAVDLLQNRFLLVVGPIPFVLLGRAWGRRHLDYGEAMGAVFGTAVGYYLVGLLVLVFSYGLYRRLGVGLQPLLLAGFGWPTTRRMLGYGWKVMLSSIIHKMAVGIEVTVLVAMLLSYSEAMGIKSLIDYKFYFLFNFLYGWCEPAVATFSEAHGAGKMQLLRYTIARYFQFGHLYCAIIFSFMVPLAPRFIRGALDPSWTEAAPLLLLACSRGLLLPAAWIIDSVQLGCGRPGLCAVLRAIEQVLRIGLFFVLVPRYQLGGVFLAMLITLGLKGAIGWFMVNRAIVKIVLPAWPAVGAPLLAGGLNWALWAAVGYLLTAAPRGVLVLAMLGAGILSFPLCFFFFGLLGGLDRQALGEMERGAGMASVFRSVAHWLRRAAEAGARLSPIAASFPEDLRLEADREAREIEAAGERVAHYQSA
ncbi:MAG: hypothetical protein RMK29_06965 [Myxococcales bacterium]|nr:hypothetical protein [Myxococcota bacterium]MDW8281434.1 hypothetical protein [Myxococcales bacterium]